MKKVPLFAVLLAVVALSSSCATAHGARYAYGKSSFYAREDTDDVSRAIFGVPLIIFGLGWDAVTLPVQAAFGVWPLWGSSSRSMEPEKTPAF